MTELDLTILAIIDRDGPLSTYDVRKVFAQSITPTWSSSTGSVYQSVRRLGDAGLITASKPQGGRSRKTISITAAGRAELRLWLKDISVATAAATPDPIRTRMFFLMSVQASERTEIVASAIRSTREALEDADRLRRARPRRPGTDLRRLASEGVLYQLRARLSWLEWLQAELASRPDNGRN